MGIAVDVPLLGGRPFVGAVPLEGGRPEAVPLAAPEGPEGAADSGRLVPLPEGATDGAKVVVSLAAATANKASIRRGGAKYIF